jgi:hypothetical protein
MKLYSFRLSRYISPNPSLLTMAVNKQLLRYEDASNNSKIQIAVATEKGAHERIRDRVEYSGSNK